ncbi:hypothetical protein D3C72_1445350 [compost metagenome]
MTAGHLFLLHIDRHAEIGATFSLSVQAGQTAPQLVLQREIIFHFYRSGKQRFDDSQLIDATIAAVLEGTLRLMISGNAAGQIQHRNFVGLCRRHRRQEIHGAGTGDAQTNAKLAAGASITVRHKAAGGFMGADDAGNA